MVECNHECGSCTENCDERQESGGIKKAPMNKFSHIKKVLCVISGKGGVGKSAVTSLLASASQRQGNRTAVLDADITGPSIPKAFGLKGRARGNGKMILPSVTSTGIKVMSINLLLDNETDPVVWRGPLLGGVVEQFWSDVVWGDIDRMFVDMPPGTGDVALTVFQSLPVDGLIIVTSPQELVSMIVEKAVNMAGLMNIPVLALVENMSYFRCPGCGKEYNIFGESHISGIASKYKIEHVVRIPLDTEVAKACDEGNIEDISYKDLDKLAASLQ